MTKGILVFHYPLRDGGNLITFGFPVGECTGYYADRAGNRFAANTAFPHLFVQYIRRKMPEKVDVYVHESACFLTFRSGNGKALEKLACLIEEIFQAVPSEEEFLKVKGETLQTFGRLCGKVEFSAALKLQESTNIRKKFSCRKLSDDLRDISYETFLAHMETLICFENAEILLFGNRIHPRKQRLLKAIAGLEKKKKLYPCGSGDVRKPQGLSEIVFAGASDRIYQAVYYDFAPDIRIKERFAVLMVSTFLIREGERAFHLDWYDASVSLFGSDGSIAALLSAVSPDRFEEARQAAIQYVLLLIRKEPERVSRMITELKLLNTSFPEAMQELTDLTFPRYREITENAGQSVSRIRGRGAE